MSSPNAAASDLLWANQVARRLLEPMVPRWRHTLGVVERARRVAVVVEPGEADVLVAAAYVHDIGYAPELARTGFHPLDGARFARVSGHERLAGLVAYHSVARAEADERGLSDQLLEFEDEHSLVSQALTYCDLTTDAEGRPTRARARIAEARKRYGPGAPEARALDRTEKALLEHVHAVEVLLSDRGRARPLSGEKGGTK